MKLTILAILVVAFVLTACGGAAARTPEDFVAAFKAAGLEAENPIAMERKDYGLAPYVGKAVHFFIPSLCPECGGRVFVGTQDEIAAMKRYYDSLGTASAAFFTWAFVSDDGRVLVQINGDMDEAQARKYEEVLNER